VFDHDHRIGSRGQRRSGHDLDGLTRPERLAQPALAGADGANDPQRRADICGPHGIAIACSAVEGRLVAVGDYGHSEGAAGSIEQRHRLRGRRRRQRGGVMEHRCERLFEGEGLVGHGIRCE
jgi:hypothetical protein